MEEYLMMNENKEKNIRTILYNIIQNKWVSRLFIAAGILLTFSFVMGFLSSSSESRDFVEERVWSVSKSSTKFVKPDELVAEKGDLIEFKRTAGIYSHWGVYVGKKFVIHLTSGLMNQAEIRKQKLDEVAKDGRCRVNNLESAAKNRGLKPRNKNIVRAAAHGYLNQFIKGTLQYSLLNSNCEHFATSCLFGEPFSLQGESIQSKPTLHFLSLIFDYSLASRDLCKATFKKGADQEDGENEL